MNKIFLGIIDRVYLSAKVLIGIGVLWSITLITSVACFKIPSDSMEPALLAGDNIVVNKWVMGGRLFNIWDAVDNKEVKIYRLPGFGKIDHNDILVFNFPYPEAWDSLGLNLRTYYVKRCVALPGDTFEISNAHYKVRGVNKTLGNVESQDSLQKIFESGEGNKKCIMIKGYPYNEKVDWNIKEFGPLYIPYKGSRVELTPVNFALYKNVIEWEQRKKLVERNGFYLLGDERIEEYCFERNYYFVTGDKTMNSQDSRYWGLLPEEFIVGKASFIWKSVNMETSRVRWNRVFKFIK